MPGAPASLNCWWPTTPSARRSTTARPRPTSARPRSAGGMTLMREDGERLVRAGITSREELVRVTRD
jgi:type II secretory ATPase GspE/PulE/Tfp pilus assembly ATPase PilB-like protein